MLFFAAKYFENNRDAHFNRLHDCKCGCNISGEYEAFNPGKPQKEFNVLVHDVGHLDPYGTVSFDITPFSTGKQVAFPHPLFAINNLGNSMILLRLCDLFLKIIISKVEKMQYLKILLVS